MMSGSVTDVNMAIEEEYSKKSNSPALTEATSYTSSPESSPQDESKNGLNTSIRRKLFEDLPKDTIDSPVATSTSLIVREAVLTPRGSETGISTTSSETTAVPSWNLSNASEKNVEVPLENFVLSQSIPLMTPPPTFPLDKTRPILSSPSSFASDESQPLLLDDENSSKHPSKSDEKENIVVEAKVVMEDPPEEPSSCNAAMNIAEIVMAFGQSARQRYQGSEQTEKTETNSVSKNVQSTKVDSTIGSKPPIISSRRVSESSSQSEKSHSSSRRSIEREGDTLKNKPNRDAYTIAKLQQAIDAQKQLNSLKEVEIVDKQVELQVLNKRIRTLQKEQEDYLEREIELHETIKILKKELDKMTLLNSAPSDELEQLKLESETSQNHAETFGKESKMAEARAKEQQTRIEDLERSLKEKEKQNFDLQTKIDWLKDQNKDEKMEKIIENLEPVQLDVRTLSANDAIEYRLKEIMKRLEAVEIEKQEIESDLEKEPDENGEEKNNIVKKIESEHDGVKINVSEDPDQIETMNVKCEANKHVDSGNQNLDSGDNSAWCCGLIPGE